ncbi:unnamed protein product [Acanthosepion pharaonis]|uniref:Uncharacterized protein n=1 Tax=Acanthosepion pharaonis TaxID=158019 RepID=A0A812D194_ACAPH|nr:unnamed protein product [Sepia pharaonis]
MYSLRFRRELEDLELGFLPAATLKSSPPGPPEMDRSPSSFIVKPLQIQITCATFSSQEMQTDRMSFRNFSSGARLFLFSKFPREVKGELIQLSGDTKKAIKRLPIKGDNSSDTAHNPERSSFRDAESRLRSNPTWKDSSFRVDSASRTYSGSSTNLPPVLCVSFGRNCESVSVMCLLDTGSWRTYLSSEIFEAPQQPGILRA